VDKKEKFGKILQIKFHPQFVGDGADMGGETHNILWLVL
jgi:hypothetical protein